MFVYTIWDVVTVLVLIGFFIGVIGEYMTTKSKKDKK